MVIGIAEFGELLAFHALQVGIAELLLVLIPYDARFLHAADKKAVRELTPLSNLAGLDHRFQKFGDVGIVHAVDRRLFAFDGALSLLNFLVRRPQTVVLAFPAIQCCLSVALVVERLSVCTKNVVKMVLQPFVESRLFLC